MSIESALRERLQAHFEPAHFELENESHKHSVPAQSETHFRVVLVSDAFAGQRPVARHQAVYSLVPDLLAAELHALAMHLYTPREWAEVSGGAPLSPDCRGGSKADAERST